MTTKINPDIFPFTENQLVRFRVELDEAGSFDQLMVIKGAMSPDWVETFLDEKGDIEKYKEKYLTGVYNSLREFYDTEVPYAFWKSLYEALQWVEKKRE